VDWVVAYVESIRSMPVAPDTSSAQLRARIAEPLPIHGRDFADLLAALQRAGSSYVSNTSINGRFALRGCVLNYRTTRGDMQTLLDDVRGAADTVTNTPEPP
jgi:hypothetical protein